MINYENVLSGIAAEYGTPAYVLIQETLDQSFLELNSAFGEQWSKSQIAYSYKTNSLMQVCNHFHAMGAWAEVTSGLEFAMAKRLGIPGQRIIFNGPYKTDDELNEALSINALINIDNFNELERVEYLCQKRDILGYGVGIRVVSSLNTQSWDKFGFDIDTGEALIAAKAIKNSLCLRLISTHAHFRSNILDIKEYRQNLHSLIAFSYLLVKENLISLKYIDIGSGIATTQPVLSASPQWQPPSFSEYARAASDCFYEENIPEDVTRILEPGRSITSKAGLLLTRVVALKKRGDRVIVIVDAGINMVPGLPMYRYPIRSLNNTQATGTDYEIHGSLCENLDVLGKMSSESIQVGDILVIENVGAYDMAGRSFTFIRPKPQVIWVDPEGQTRIVRRNEAIEDLLGTQHWI